MISYKNMSNPDLLEALKEADEEADRAYETRLHHNMFLPYLSWYQANRVRSNTIKPKHDRKAIIRELHKRGLWKDHVIK